MLARREMPTEYERWNKTWGVPNGRLQTAVGVLSHFPSSLARLVLRSRPMRRSRGPFGFQQNTTTRAFEYPWVHQQLAGLGPSRILDIGGALSGMQFVLAKEGHDVHNVDPFYDFGSGEYDIDPVAEHALLNRIFDTNVTLHRSTLPEAGLSGQFDVILCISTIEHFSPEDIDSTLEEVRRLLTPGGLVILTIDLFLDLAPFCSRATNVWGSNASVARIDDVLGYTLVAGDRHELNGYPEFDTDAILGRLGEFAIGAAYPQLAQVVSFRSPVG